jgi:signal transduction histidine kinase
LDLQSGAVSLADTRDENEGLDMSAVHLLFDGAPHGVAVSKGLSIIYANKLMTEIIEAPIKNIVGHSMDEVADFLEPPEDEIARSAFGALESGELSTSTGIFTITLQGNTRKSVRVTANAINIGKHRYIIAYVIDVTEDQMNRAKLSAERKAYSVIAEAALSTAGIPETSEKVLKGLTESIGFDIGTIRLLTDDGEVLKLIASIGLEPGGTPDEVRVDDPDFLVARTARTKQPMFTQEMARTKESVDRMARAKKLGIHSLIFWPILGSEGNLIGVINIASKAETPLDEEDKGFFETVAGMFSTIIERRRTEEELRESQERFLAFADNMPGPVYIKDHKSGVLFVNRFMRRRPIRDEWEGMKPEQLFRKNHAEKISEEDQRVIEMGPIDRVQSFSDDDGLPRTYRSHKFPIIREDKPPLIGGFSIDITEQVEAQKQREEAMARAEFFNDLMAHDINNMHQGIMSSLELILAAKGCSEEIQKIAESALQQVNRSVSLINNVKKFSLINREDITLEKTDPAHSLAAAIEMVKQSFPASSIEVETNLRSGVYCIMANEFLQDVFYNILHNSVKNTTGENVRIEVHSSLEDDGDFLRLDIEDWGCGMDDTLKENILRGLDDRVRRVSGVGLTLVKRIVDIFRGEISVADRVDGDYRQGTRFTIRLPNGC